MKSYFVYILTNPGNSVLYIGVTNNLERRILEHKQKKIDGFTKKYNCTKLVFFEETDSVHTAIEREKQLKNWHRNWKINLVKSQNLKWEDLSRDWFDPAFFDAETKQPNRHSEFFRNLKRIKRS
ncbi:GIY-YIG nuclease family protein [bacterium]|jgi:putative endonuclease|nr:GIY-YIG nuclease family protein [bacterium]MBT6832209.1 GIY-YIG nuclease family protein [bacterium]MBT6996154.1 GIY-YIG nuclease family protein [bacterium]MBT7772234.1 GIY-YIG nuclease family protein [bacterium]